MCFLLLVTNVECLCRAMGMEETCVSLDKEFNYVSVYCNGDFGSSSDGTDVIHDERVDSFDLVINNNDSQMLEESSDSNGYEEKQCTTENVEPVILARVVESSEEKPVFVNDVGNGLKEKLADELEPLKGKIKSRPIKRSSKNFTRGVKSSCTVPQQFTLATEKRASTGSTMSHELKSSPTKDSKLRKVIRYITDFLSPLIISIIWHC